MDELSRRRFSTQVRRLAVEIDASLSNNCTTKRPYLVSKATLGLLLGGVV
jgi:hypothetical protein